MLVQFCPGCLNAALDLIPDWQPLLYRDAALRSEAGQLPQLGLISLESAHDLGPVLVRGEKLGAGTDQSLSGQPTDDLGDDEVVQALGVNLVPLQPPRPLDLST